MLQISDVLALLEPQCRVKIKPYQRIASPQHFMGTFIASDGCAGVSLPSFCQLHLSFHWAQCTCLCCASNRIQRCGLNESRDGLGADEPSGPESTQQCMATMISRLKLQRIVLYSQCNLVLLHSKCPLLFVCVASTFIACRTLFLRLT